MSTAPNRYSVTDGESASGCVRAPQTPPPVSSRPNLTLVSAHTPVHTRAISQETDIRPPAQGPKRRSFLSPHLRDTRNAAAGSWFGRDRPRSLDAAAVRVAPAKGEAGNWLVWTAMTAAGLLRLAALAVVYLAAFCVDGRIRATVTAIFVAAAIAAHHYL